MSAPTLILYTRQGCHLCEEAHDLLRRLREERVAFDLEVQDVDADPVLRERYGVEVPVLFVEGRKFAKVRVDEARLRRRLAYFP